MPYGRDLDLSGVTFLLATNRISAYRHTSGGALCGTPSEAVMELRLQPNEQFWTIEALLQRLVAKQSSGQRNIWERRP